MRTMLTKLPSNAEMFRDEAIYRRTSRGQRELLRSDGSAISPELRVLARVNGFTDLRSLVELAPNDVREIAHAIRRLVADDLIELADTASSQPRRRNTL